MPKSPPEQDFAIGESVMVMHRDTGDRVPAVVTFATLFGVRRPRYVYSMTLADGTTIHADPDQITHDRAKDQL